MLEDGGAPVTIGLNKKDQFKKAGCQFGGLDGWVKVCNYGNMCCIYKVVCNTCQESLEPEVRLEHSKTGGTKTSHYLDMKSTSLHNRPLRLS